MAEEKKVEEKVELPKLPEEKIDYNKIREQEGFEAMQARMKAEEAKITPDKLLAMVQAEQEGKDE